MRSEWKKPIAIIILWFAAIMAIASCDAADPAASANDQPYVVCTTGIVGDTVRRIAGEHARVESLMSPGVDPHLYKATESDVRRLADADLIIYNGLHLEGKMADILVKMARQRPVVAVTDGLPENRLREPPEFEGQYDPHIWFDVELWSQTLDTIVEALSEIDPDHAADYASNAAAFRDELIALDAWVKERINEIPAERRILITAHDAFGYFGARYDIEVMGLQGISTVTEAGLLDVERIVDTVVSRGVRAIFVESSVPKRSIEAVQEACRSRDFEVAIGGELFSDSMGPAGTEEGTYVGMVRHNANTIADALQ
ncbi:MAG: metal ABC transporter solute-binding protein, Zn/Mn family [Phycisphaerales bacterium]